MPHDQARSHRLAFTLLVAALLGSGCTAEVLPAGLSEAELLQLDLAAPGLVPDPPQVPIPPCWWTTDDLDRCDDVPRCIVRPPETTPPSRPRTVVQLSAATRSTTPAGATRVAPSQATTLTVRPEIQATGPAAGPRHGGPTDVQAPYCPDPNPIVDCPTCATRDGLDPRILQFQIPQLSSRLLVTNGTAGGGWAALDLLLPRSDGPEAVSVHLDDATLMAGQGSVDYDASLYLFVTREYESGPYPYENWFYCPSGGGHCVLLPRN